LLEQELCAAAMPNTLQLRYRYPQRLIRSHRRWQPRRVEGERWFGFERVSVLSREQFDILMIPLPGHSAGHCGVAVSTTEGWMLHCGDAYFHQSEMMRDGHLPKALDLLESFTEVDHDARIANRDRLATLAQDPHNRIRLFCSHDHDEFNACCAHPVTLGRFQG
jgi:glyoxylase-like metal-dependent hydrolase (beta-lactamase superfamily II)